MNDYNDNDIEFSTDPPPATGSGSVCSPSTHAIIGRPLSNHPDDVARGDAAEATFAEVYAKHTAALERPHDQDADVIDAARRHLGDVDDPTDQQLDEALAAAEALSPAEQTFNAAAYRTTKGL